MVVDHQVVRGGAVLGIVHTDNNTIPDGHDRSPAAGGEINPKMHPLPGGVYRSPIGIGKGRVPIGLDQEPSTRPRRGGEWKDEGWAVIGRSGSSNCPAMDGPAPANRRRQWCDRRHRFTNRVSSGSPAGGKRSARTSGA